MQRQGETTSCVSIEKEIAETAISTLKKEGLIRNDLKIKKDAKRVIIPVINSSVSHAVLQRQNIVAEECVEHFERRQRYTRKEIIEEIESREGLMRTSYHQIGDILVMNLKSHEEIERSKITAEILMKRLKNVKAVYAKIGTHFEYRIPEIVHLMGEKRTFTVTKEYGILLAVDVAKAFYNPRLTEEHRRVALEIREGKTVLDMFTGVGGFCLHIAVNRRCEIFCNDINPYAISLLNISIIMNAKKLISQVHTLNVDAALLPSILSNKRFDEIIMNHPTGSLKYLKTANELISDRGNIHLYVLSKGSRDLIRDEITSILKERDLPYEASYVREVLDYSPSQKIFYIKLERTA